MTSPLEIDPSMLSLEPEPEPAPVASPAADLAIADILPADFPLPLLTRFVPDPALKAKLQLAIDDALAVDVTTDDGLVVLDERLAVVRERMKVIEQHFEEPATIAFRLHRGVTSVRGDWMKPGTDCLDIGGGRLTAERRRRDALAAEQRRRDQAEADRLAQEAKKREADAAAAQGAPPVVVEQMKAQAEVAKAAPVPAAPRASYGTALKHTSVVTTHKARIKGTPADADPNPSVKDLTPAQMQEVRQLLLDIADGKQPITCIELNWSVMNARAKAEGLTLAITGIEAFEVEGTRAKGTRGGVR